MLFSSLLNVSLLPYNIFSDWTFVLYLMTFLVSSFCGLIKSKLCLYSDCLFVFLLKSFINLLSVRLMYILNMNMLDLLL